MKKAQTISAAFSLLLFFCLAAAVKFDQLSGTELRIYNALMHTESPAMTYVMRFASFLCDPFTLIVICILLLVVPQTRRTVAIPVCGAVVVSAGLSTILKHFSSANARIFCA